jgi:hypothetical protein
MKRAWFAIVVTAAALCGLAQSASAQTQTWGALLSGADEVPPISSTATGTFYATVGGDGSINFTLTFEGLTTTPLFSHIHFGQKDVAGGVMIFLCSGGGQPACPAATSGSIQGTIAAANVTGPATQGVDPGDIAKAMKAVASGEGYVNLHTTKFPGGEIRGQVKVVGN